MTFLDFKLFFPLLCEFVVLPVFVVCMMGNGGGSCFLGDNFFSNSLELEEVCIAFFGMKPFMTTPPLVFWDPA